MTQAITETKIQKYPAYKDSGVEWLGEIPEHWECFPGCRFMYESRSRNVGMIRSTVLSLSYGNIRVKQDDELTGLVPESFESYQLVNKDDLIFRPTDLQNDVVSLRSSISKYDGIITSAYLNFRFDNIASSKFFHYVFRAIDNNKVIYGLGSGLRQNITFSDFRRFRFPFPPLSEQTAIAEFLDRKIALIDKAIAIKEKQIELLKERRQILIHKAVTRGLNPNAKMKDSGVEWIGEIPEGWEVKRLKYFGTIRSGDPLTNSSLSDEGPYEVFGGNGVMGFYERYNTMGNKIIIGRVGAYCGNIRLIDGKKWISDNALILSLKEESYYQFFAILLAAGNLNKLNSSNAQPLITGSKVLNFLLPIPSKSECSEIVSFYANLNGKIENSIYLKKQEIEKLKEYKATLINSAVTGKIKVC